MQSTATITIRTGKLTVRKESTVAIDLQIRSSL